MRCMTRSEVVVDRSFVVYFQEFPCPSVICANDEETHKCPVGKVPSGVIKILHPNSRSSGKHVSLSKGSHRDKRIL